MTRTAFICLAFALSAMAEVVVPDPKPVVPAASPVSAVQIAIPTVDVPDIKPASVDTPDAGIAESSALYKAFESLTRDRRSLGRDAGFSAARAGMREWLDIYRNHIPVFLPSYPVPADVRMIAEARCPVSNAQRDILLHNLAYYRDRGYNAVLVTLYGGEPGTALLTMIDDIKASGMAIWFALSGRESLEDTVFIDPVEIDRLFWLVAKEAAGMLIGWRRTSAHLLLMDEPYMDLLTTTARKYNDKLCIAGEVYYGANAQSGDRTNAFACNIPSGASAVIAVGMGYDRTVPAMALRLCRKAADKPALIVISGPAPYAVSKAGVASPAAFQEAKERLESRFRSAGFAGSITLHGDGSDGIYDSRVVDNMSASMTIR